jgi:hypothetical protein
MERSWIVGYTHLAPVESGACLLMPVEFFKGNCYIHVAIG